MLKRKKYDFDLIVIGSGAGGSVGAHQAAGRGKKVALFEKGKVGGECPNFACVPTKALLHAAHTYSAIASSKSLGIDVEKITLDGGKIHAWKNLVVERTGASHGEEAFRHDNITLIKEKAEFISPHEVEAEGKVYSAEKFLLATGTKESIPPIPGLEETGYLTFKSAINLSSFPESMFIMGGGAVACELGQIFARFGVKVTIAIRGEKLLSKEDSEVQDLVHALFENDGITILTKTGIDKVEKHGTKTRIHYTYGSEKKTTDTEALLIAIGKTPVLDVGLEKAGVHLGEHHSLRVNRYLQTNVPHIFAAGDIVGPYQFTHTGYYQSDIAAHNAFARNKIQPDYRVVPRAVFLSPEVASVGVTERELQEKKIPYKKGIAPIAVLGRANTSNEMDGFAKVLTDKNERILGASIVAPAAGELIHTIALAMKLRASASDISRLIVAYPTFSEALKLACSSLE